MNKCLDLIDWEALVLRCRGNVSVMSGHTSISRKTIERYFKSKWGVTPKKWAKSKMLERAMALIKKGYSNKAVVMELGFCSESWLCREFRNFSTR
jgi:methylphosphotriester-DNA--protein-cysteine methyltransferase